MSVLIHIFVTCPAPHFFCTPLGVYLFAELYKKPSCKFKFAAAFRSSFTELLAILGVFFFTKTEFGHFVGKQSAITYYDVSFFTPAKVNGEEVVARSRLAAVGSPLDATNMPFIFPMRKEWRRIKYKKDYNWLQGIKSI